MPYQTDLLEALHDWLSPTYVREVNDWPTRGRSSFNPGGSVNHHVAGARNGSIPSLRILVEGRSDLPGPLCNVAQSRSSEYDPGAEYDIVYLVAAGRANHAGLGGWSGLRGNSSVFGLEIEHVGVMSREPFPERRQRTAHRVHRAFMEVGGFDASKVCQHEEWAPSRKIDFVDADFQGFRNAIRALDNPAGDSKMYADLIRASYIEAGRSDPLVNDPRGYAYWLAECAKRTTHQSRMELVNYVRHLLKVDLLAI